MILRRLRPATVLKKQTLAQVFSCEFCEISRNTFYTEHLRTTASTWNEKHFSSFLKNFHWSRKNQLFWRWESNFNFVVAVFSIMYCIMYYHIMHTQISQNSRYSSKAIQLCSLPFPITHKYYQGEPICSHLWYSSRVLVTTKY